MCGIWLYIAQRGTYDINTIFASSQKLKSRGPDRNCTHKLSFNDYDIYLSFYRLAIMDLSTDGDQPFVLQENSRTIYLLCNGEIYNYKYLVDKYNLQDKLKSHSDCEVLIHLYSVIGLERLYDELMSDHVDGEFAMIILDMANDKSDMKVHVLRDMGGVRPLYEGINYHSICYSSQLIALPYKEKLESCSQFKPYSYKTLTFKDNSYEINHKIFSIRDFPVTIYDEQEALDKIYDTLTICVEQRLAADREIMVMCSGGLDSSLCAGIAANYYKKENNGDINQKINTMSIGLEGGTDEKYAKLVADFIKSNHQHILCTEEEFLNAAKNRVIDTLESYDITSVRASTGQLIAAEKTCELTNCKVIIVGDYSDEITGGYNETKYAPDVDAYRDRIYELVEEIYCFDSQRVDRCIASQGLEARTPFGDHRFIKLYMSIDPVLRMPKDGCEKYLLRKAFSGKDIIPEEVLWRPKEAFSDGVSSLKKSWYQILQEDINKLYDDIDLEDLDILYPFNTPFTKESLHLRKRFCQTFTDNPVVAQVIPRFWLPKWGNVKEPSARILSVYKS
jgi:asparagine synthase (glutamine-hydrolysing)